jgi:hypothetical protein
MLHNRILTYQESKISVLGQALWQLDERINPDRLKGLQFNKAALLAKYAPLLGGLAANEDAAPDPREELIKELLPSLNTYGMNTHNPPSLSFFPQMFTTRC